MLGFQSMKTPATIIGFEAIRMFKTRQFRISIEAASGGIEDGSWFRSLGFAGRKA
jgi:hypothetical protein